MPLFQTGATCSVKEFGQGQSSRKNSPTGSKVRENRLLDVLSVACFSFIYLLSSLKRDSMHTKRRGANVKECQNDDYTKSDAPVVVLRVLRVLHACKPVFYKDF